MVRSCVGFQLSSLYILPFTLPGHFLFLAQAIKDSVSSYLQEEINTGLM